MKFSLFVHMERLDASQNHQELYEEFIQLCEIADKGGEVGCKGRSGQRQRRQHREQDRSRSKKRHVL